MIISDDDSQRRQGSQRLVSGFSPTQTTCQLWAIFSQSKKCRNVLQNIEFLDDLSSYVKFSYCRFSLFKTSLWGLREGCKVKDQTCYGFFSSQPSLSTSARPCSWTRLYFCCKVFPYMRPSSFTKPFFLTMSYVLLDWLTHMDDTTLVCTGNLSYGSYNFLFV